MNMQGRHLQAEELFRSKARATLSRFGIVNTPQAHSGVSRRCTFRSKGCRGMHAHVQD